MHCCFAAQPAAAGSSPELAPLERHLAALARSQPTELGIAAFDLGSNASICINCEAAFPMASTVKVAVAAAYLSQVDYGRRSLDDMIGGRRASRLIEDMLIHSSNPATDRLIRNLGGPSAVDGWLRFHGLSGIRVDRTIAQLLIARRDLWDVRDSSTPVAMIEMLKKIETGDVLKPSSHAYLLSLMRSCMTGKNRIRGLLPAGRSSREQDRHPVGPDQRRRLHYPAGWPQGCGRLLRARRHRPAPRYRGGGAGHLLWVRQPSGLFALRCHERFGWPAVG